MTILFKKNFGFQMNTARSVIENKTAVKTQGNDNPATAASNIADVLFNQGKINAEQLKEIKFEAINSGKSFQDLIIEKGLSTEEEIVKLKSQIYKIDFIDLRNISISTEILQKIPQEIARKNLAITFKEDSNLVHVAMVNPLDLQIVKYFSTLTGKRVKPYFSTSVSISQVIDTKYGAQVGDDVAEALEDVGDTVNIKTSVETVEELTGDLSNAPVSRIVNMILEYAAKYKSSDIHIEPGEEKLLIRFRINGVMSEKLSLPKKLIAPVISRIKILADLKIDEHRIPQDGRFQIQVDDNKIDLRVSIIPSIYGEKIVMRLLEKSGNILPLEKTGIRGSGYKTYINGLHKTQGIILITGPTGSGKTQTLASSLSILNKPDVNIITLEDPVEIRIDGVTQVQINADVGLTFAKGLRSFLRQDPDIIMVGEIRDVETAELAIQASLTGHLVLATLHTNSAAGALPRLLDMGVQPYLLASTVNVIVGQRLVRTLNERCTTTYTASDDLVAQIQRVLGQIQGYDIYKIAGDDDKVELYKPSDTPECVDRGYSGRTGIFEVMSISEVISQMIVAKKSSQEIEQQAVLEGMVTMTQDGFMKAIEGVTSIEEVLRVQS